MDSMKDGALTQIGMHSVRQRLGDGRRPDEVEDRPRQFAEEYGITLHNPIDQFGTPLSSMEGRIVEAILHGLSLTNYEGNLSSLSLEEVAEEKFSGKLPPAYKYIRKIPRLRVSQSDILRWAGVEHEHAYNWGRAIEALEHLGSRQFCFYYNRLALDKAGNPVRGSDGKFRMEEVVTVDTLFTVQKVRDGQTKAFKHYDITPSVVFLDQRESYFLLVPRDWQDEVRRLCGPKKVSSYTFLFLIYLRYQYELRRRSTYQKSPYELRVELSEIGKALKMPYSLYKKKPSRALKLLGDAYSVAKQLDYLTDYEIEEKVHVLKLNDDKFLGLYCKEEKQQLTEKEQKKKRAAQGVFTLFHSYRKQLDPLHQAPKGSQAAADMILLDRLLAERSESQLSDVIRWSMTRSYWCSRLSTIGKLAKHIGEAVSEMMLDHKRSKAPEDNRAYAERASQWCRRHGGEVQIHTFAKEIEVRFGSGHVVACIGYDSSTFREQLLTALKRCKLTVSEDEL